MTNDLQKYVKHFQNTFISHPNPPPALNWDPALINLVIPLPQALIWDRRLFETRRLNGPLQYVPKVSYTHMTFWWFKIRTVCSLYLEPLSFAVSYRLGSLSFWFYIHSIHDPLFSYIDWYGWVRGCLQQLGHMQSVTQVNHEENNTFMIPTTIVNMQFRDV